ncbi:hypothetical protein PUMCH_001944 [Australozyma saopauloensis]|uniref:Uncharacterized protein n=1 Tax=Australozyma saopauloensis TaxID=291208 RepID=A0AAX4H840_9ASCO|nr:hypothetical protein PUMCH_001944 [[Candida] saopauloensis]
MTPVSENEILRGPAIQAKKMARDNSQSGYESGSLSDTDSLTEDLDQIGKLSMPKWSSWSKEKFPSLVNFYGFGSLPALPNLANISGLPQLPNLSGFPNLPNIPQFLSLSSHIATLSSNSSLPHFDLAEVSRYISQYVNSVKSQDGTSTPEAEVRLVNSIKTALATRIQMHTFLSDLREGLTLQAAIDRLQPLTELVHEAITLPADDDDDIEHSDDEKIAEHDTEPGGIWGIVNREQPIVNEIVVPEEDTISDLRNIQSKRRKKHKAKDMKRSTSIHSDEYDSSMYNTGSDLDNVDELTKEEARVLTHLESLDDFFKEDLLRQKIQRIQRHENLSQSLKNKLVTKLMMGNYYKYINEKLMKEQGIQLQSMDRLTIRNETPVPASEPEGDEISIDKRMNTTGNFTQSVEREVDQSMGDEFSEDDIEQNPDDDEEVVLTEKDTTPSYHNVEKKILGCSHYQRNCKLECSQCLQWYTCRFCHDAEVGDHKLVRSDVKHILCMHCNVPQLPDTNYCVNCEEELANYFCKECVLYDNDPDKDIYHCDKCGICRLGLGLSKDYFHCDTCNICLTIDLKDNHKCVTNTTHCNCPICNDYLFTSVSKVVFMKCGHLIHQSCYDEMIKHSYKCPICKKTVINSETQFRILDQEIRQLPLPPPYNMWRCIVNCNDCKGKSNCAYHVLGLKCKYCQSYNTHQVKLIKPEEEDDKTGAVAVENEESFSERVASMRLMKTNLSSNFVIDEKIIDTPNEYDGDINENSDEEGMTNFVNFKSLTNSILGKNSVDRKSITAAFQSFINSSIMDKMEDDYE